MTAVRHTDQILKNQQLRKEMIHRRKALPAEERMSKSVQITQIILRLPIWQKAQEILLYVSYEAEVSTLSLLKAALLEGKQVYCPKVEGKDMRFYRIEAIEDLQPGFRGILEPPQNKEPWKPGNTALMIVPGTVFDQRGHRIGYGGGYYDRFLGGCSKEERPYSIGICFACQMTERIIPAAYDQDMDLVITEEKEHDGFKTTV